MKKIIIALIAVLGVAVNANAQKFGHVDTQSIMHMQEEIQRKADEFDKKKSTMNATDQQAAEQELQTLYNKLQETYQQNQQNIQKKQEELMAPINQKIMKAIENVGKAGNYTYIVPAGSFPYIGATSTDVTAAVKAEINKIK